eukprot:jgi/Psemu1/262833/estExt_Genewise1Plus.C_8550006
MCNAVSMAAGGVAVFLVSTECMNRKIFCGNFMEGVALLIAWTTALAVYAMFGTEECGTNFNNHHLFDRISHDYNNATATMLFPEVFQHIPFGDTCNWGPGASYNIVAALLYFACGVLLCISPHSNPLFGGGDDDGEGRGRRRKKNKKRKSSKSDLSVALEYDCEDWYENHPNWTNLSETLPETTTKADLERELKLDEESASMHDWYEPEASPSAATATSRSSSSSSSKKTKKSSKKTKSKTNLSGSSIEITPDVNKVV